MSLRPVRIDWNSARDWIRARHRHLGAPVGRVFHLACRSNASHPLCGVVVVGRPVARGADTGDVAEVTRLTSDGCSNVCTYLYAAARRVARDHGFRKLITYTRADEQGTSLRAAGFVLEEEIKGRNWSCAARPREQMEIVDKVRWGTSL